MDTKLDSLDPVFRPLAFVLLARFMEARIPVVIVNTRRTAVEQQAALARGVSWVAHSKHEDGLAIDVAPFSMYALHADNKLLWDTNDPVWLALGRIGEGLGLRWGGRFKPINTLGVGKDPGHFEYVAPATPAGAVA